MFWPALAASLYVLGLLTWLFYVAIMHLKKVRNDLHPFAKFNAYILLSIGLILDVAVNLILGTILFLEPPHEFLFTNRLQRHKANKGWRKELASWLCEHLLNQFDKGHC